MATVESTRGLPAELSERFLPQEAPSFEVVRAVGEVLLWRSTTTPHRLHGLERPSKVHYHVTVGDQADCLLMRDMATAIANFEAVADHQSGGKS